MFGLKRNKYIKLVRNKNKLTLPDKKINLMKKNKKVFVIDTNVILHDFKCLYKFQENDIVLPIVVLEELDHLKKGDSQINFHAREFTRELDKLSGDNLFNGGIALGKGLGKLSIETGKPYSDKLKQSS